MKRVFYLSPLLFLGDVTLAQEKTAAIVQPVKSGNIHMDILIVVFILMALIILLAAVLMLKAVRIMANEIANPIPYSKGAPARILEYEEWAAMKKAKPGIWTRILGLRPISEEKDMMMEHKFDGIAELNNPTPAWFMWLFYGTIAFAIIYLAYYHVLGYGKMQEEEYAVEMKEAKSEQNAYLAKSANNIDENSVTQNAEGSTITAGQAIFNTNCIACHGDKGQGIVGPNLTDVYWIHGGKINNIFKTIKYGVPEKGMISWEKTLNPKQISDVANYILSLKGSNPPNGKAPQGDKEG
jgi:cytochrome c oxidase cbb3-type subunit III